LPGYLKSRVEQFYLGYHPGILTTGDNKRTSRWENIHRKITRPWKVKFPGLGGSPSFRALLAPRISRERGTTRNLRDQSRLTFSQFRARSYAASAFAPMRACAPMRASSQASKKRPFSKYKNSAWQWGSEDTNKGNRMTMFIHLLNFTTVKPD